MTVINYAKIYAKVKTIFAGNTRTIKLIKSGSADSVQPWNGEAVDSPETFIEVQGFQILPSAVRIFGLAALGESAMNRGLINEAEIVYVVDAGEVDLKQFIFVEDEGIRYKIDATQGLRPKDITILGYLGVSR
jgi:hypothetical protein